MSHTSLIKRITEQRLVTLSIGPFIWSPSIFTTVLTLGLLVLLINLGMWQIERGDFKESREAQQTERSTLTPISAPDFIKQLQDTPDTERHYASADFPLTAQGHYLHEQTLLLDNRTHQGTPGYQVITPLDMGEYILLVNRGWVAQGADRTVLPKFPQPSGLQHIAGTSHYPNPDFFVLEEDRYDQVSWPFLVQKIDIDRTATLFSKPLAPFTLRLAADANSGFVREWHTTNTMPAEKHYGYAFQWFALATALLVIYTVTNTKRRNPQ